MSVPGTLSETCGEAIILLDAAQATIDESDPLATSDVLALQELFVAAHAFVQREREIMETAQGLICG